MTEADSFYTDPRIREFIAPASVPFHENVINTRILPGNTRFQCVETPETQIIRFCIRSSWLVIDYGRELHGGIRIVSTSNGSKIRIRFGESLSECMNDPDPACSVTDTILDVPLAGTLEYGNTGFRFIRIDCLGAPFNVINIAAVSIMTPVVQTGSFECSDERLNRIWQIGVRTTHLCMQEYVYDGIKRDRRVWMGDLYPEAHTMFAAYGDWTELRRSLEFLRSVTPAGNYMNGIASYTVWWILTQYELYQRSGDFAFLKLQKEFLLASVKKLCSETARNGAERLSTRYVDWPSYEHDNAIHAALQGILLLGLEHARKLYDILGIEHGGLDFVISRVKSHVPECGNSKAAAAVQTLSGLADRGGVLDRDPFRGFGAFFGTFVIQARRDPRAVLETIRKYWGGMLDLGATSFWEDFDPVLAEKSCRIDALPKPGERDYHREGGMWCFKGYRQSLCHGWASGPVLRLSELFTGLRILKPGFRDYSLDPHLYGLDWATVKIPTPGGVITVIQKKGKKPVVR